MKLERAETIALQALTWLIGHEELRPVFMGATGASEADLRERALEPAFQAAILRFLVMDDAWIIAFCDAHGLAYDQPMRALQAMPGAVSPDWT
jgi:hypothetical protein